MIIDDFNSIKQFVKKKKKKLYKTTTSTTSKVNFSCFVLYLFDNIDFETKLAGHISLLVRLTLQKDKIYQSPLSRIPSKWR